MKRSLLSLLAALALSTVVNAETYWIIIGFGSGGKDSPAALEKIHIWSILDCENNGEKWLSESSGENPKNLFLF